MDEVRGFGIASAPATFYAPVRVQARLGGPANIARAGSEAARVVNAIGAIARARVIEKARLKGAVCCGTFCMPEGSGIRRKGCRRRRDRPLLEAISCFRAARDFNLPGCDQTAMTLVSRQARQTVRRLPGFFIGPTRALESTRRQSRRE